MDALASSEETVVRRDYRESDAAAIIELHRQVYIPEYGLNETMVQSVHESVQRALRRGWPGHGGIWLVDRGDAVRGSLGLTHEENGVGRLRWFVLERALRGGGLGTKLVAELIDKAIADGLVRLELETFSELVAAAHIYKSFGFRLVWERPLEEWGKPLTYQRYALQLR